MNFSMRLSGLAFNADFLLSKYLVFNRFISSSSSCGGSSNYAGEAVLLVMKYARFFFVNYAPYNFANFIAS